MASENPMKTSGGAESVDVPSVEPVLDGFTAEERDRLRVAADAEDYDSLRDYVRDAALQAADDVLDDDGPYVCPRDGCGDAFATKRELRGHLGSPKHELDTDGEAWCGRCGFGPTTPQGIRAHHGQADSHDGSPVLLDAEPSTEDLIDPVEVADHRNEELLRRLYREHDGNYSAMCRAHDFDVTPGRVREALIRFGIHEVTRQGTLSDRLPGDKDADWLRTQYDQHDGNISEMHRRLDVDVPYRTLQNWVQDLDVHDPTDPPGKRHGKGGPEIESETTDSSEEVAEATEHTPDDAGDQPQSNWLPGPVRAVLDVESPGDVSDYSDLRTPDWLDESSWYMAVDVADDVDELSRRLGWHDQDAVAAVAQLVGVNVDGADQFDLPDNAQEVKLE